MTAEQKVEAQLIPRLLKIIVKPHVSEKTANHPAGISRYAFDVVKDANKIEIKKAIEYLFNVRVNAVNTLNPKAKQKKFKQIKGTRTTYKKAYVTLEPGHEINLVEKE
jgi:large subunit ribosomal protein L23